MSVRSYLDFVAKMAPRACEAIVAVDGIAFPSADLDESERLVVERAIALFTARGFTVVPKHCYLNAWRLTHADKTQQLQYVEGFAAIPECGLPIQHAWCSINGKVVDLTWARFAPIFDVHDAEYIGRIFSRKALKVLKCKGSSALFAHARMVLGAPS